MTLIWLNGPFGGGKTQTAYELSRRMPGSVVCDPEHPGFGLRRMLPPTLRGDFQDLSAWRAGVVEVLDLTLRAGIGPVIAPMTVIEPKYFEETVGRLRNLGHEVHHFSLLARRETVLKRLRERAFGRGLQTLAGKGPKRNGTNAAQNADGSTPSGDAPQNGAGSTRDGTPLDTPHNDARRDAPPSDAPRGDTPHGNARRDGDSPQQRRSRETWAVSMLDICLERLQDTQFATHVWTDTLSIPEVADHIATMSGLTLRPNTDPWPVAYVRRTLTKLKHIRFD